VDGGGRRRSEPWTAAAAAIAQGRGRGIKPGRPPIASVRGVREGVRLLTFRERFDPVHPSTHLIQD
jgi:hypothetical protein